MSDDVSLAGSRDTSKLEADEPQYVNFRPHLTRTNSAATVSMSGVKKKPKPGPKPSAVTTAIAKLNLQPSQVQLERINAGSVTKGKPAPGGVKPSLPNKPNGKLTTEQTNHTSEVRPPIACGSPTFSSTVAKAATQVPSVKPTADKPRTAAFRTSSNELYCEAAEVQLSRLPAEERDNFKMARGHSDGECIYEEALPVKVTHVDEDTDIYCEAVPVKLQSKVKKLPDIPQGRSTSENRQVGVSRGVAAGPPEEVIYEEAAIVCKDRLSSFTKPSDLDSVFVDPDPLYAEAIDVIPGRLSSKQLPTKGGKMPSSSTATYEEAFIVKKPSEDSDNSESDDEAVDIKIILRSTYEQSRNMWSLKADPTRAKADLERTVHRMSMMFSNSRPQATMSSKFDPHHLEHLAKSGLVESLGSVPMRTLNVWPHSPTNHLDPAGSMLKALAMSGSDSNSSQMRLFLIRNILVTEKEHLAVLDKMTEYMKLFKSSTPPLIPETDIGVIFFKIPDLHEAYYKFVHALEPLLTNWAPEQVVGPVFKEFAFEEYSVAPQYLSNYQKAVSTVQRCSNEYPKFSDIIKAIKCKGGVEKSLADLLLLPILQFQRNALLLEDLIKATPTTHTDYDLFQKTLKLAHNCLNDSAGIPSKEILPDQRYLVRSGVVVEQTKTRRKLRSIFVFNDLIVCARQKLVRQVVSFDVKWFIGLPDIRVDDKLSVQEEKTLAAMQQQKIDELKKKLVESQLELREELKKAHAADGQRLVAKVIQSKTVEKLRKKIAELETELILSSPYLIFKLNLWKTQTERILLMQSDYERNNWKETIKGLSSKVMGPVKPSLAEVQALLNQQKAPSGSVTDTSELALEDCLTGNLNITIHKLRGLSEPASTFCCVEIDSFGHFFEKAKTRVINSAEPCWAEDFDIDLEGSHTLRILCYKLGAETDRLIGTSALELSQVWLMQDIKEEDITLKEGVVVTISLHYTAAEDLMTRTDKETLFGGRLENLTKKEGSFIPLVVTSCIQELEKRGLSTIGLYRVCGRADAVDSLKKDFNRNSSSASSKLSEIDTSVLTSLIKLYFRELPEALFTDNLYPEFVKGMELSDPDAKEKFMVSLLCSLPAPNFTTATYVLDHLVRVSKYEQVNKMSLHNLAVVFGPTLIRPAIKETRRTPMEQLIYQNNEALMQTSILLYFLNLKEKNCQFIRQC